MKALIKSMLAKLGSQLQRLPSGPHGPIHLWDTHDEFNSIMKQIVGYTLCDKTKCFVLYQFAKQVACLPGGAAEVGVYKGGTARLLAKIFERIPKNIHLFDTFSGMPLPDQNKDIHKGGDFSDTSLESVKAYLSDCKNIHFYQGIFPATVTPIQNMRFCFVHIDVDIYRSTMDCCKFFYPRMEKGGIMIVDDYGTLDCPGVKMAVNEYLSDKPEYPCYLPTGQCVIIHL